MKQIFPGSERGLTRIDWLTSYHSFSFGNFYDPHKMNFGPLRVINDDFVAPGGGFPTHPHNNMEIITIVLEGELSHADSTGIAEKIRYGEIQKMSAGRGIYHSEFNDSDTETVHLLQIWIIPDQRNIEPSYEKRLFSPEAIKNTLFKIGGKAEGSPVSINQDAELYISSFEKGKEFSYNVEEGRMVYIHAIDGNTLTGLGLLKEGDAFGTDEPGIITLKFDEESRFILFDLKRE